MPIYRFFDPYTGKSFETTKEKEWKRFLSKSLPKLVKETDKRFREVYDAIAKQDKKKKASSRDTKETPPPSAGKEREEIQRPEAPKASSSIILPDNLSDLSKEELLKFAYSHDIPVDGRWSKERLIKAIKKFVKEKEKKEA